MKEQKPLLIILSVLFALIGVVVTGRSASPLPTLIFLGIIVGIVLLFAWMKKKEEKSSSHTDDEDA